MASKLFGFPKGEMWNSYAKFNIATYSCEGRIEVMTQKFWRHRRRQRRQTSFEIKWTSPSWTATNKSHSAHLNFIPFSEITSVVRKSWRSLDPPCLLKHYVIVNTFITQPWRLERNKRVELIQKILSGLLIFRLGYGWILIYRTTAY
jgi:phenylpropionate dioxygenase-like ring-hydroxylating dioxygenase large terminal subunit